MTPEHFSEVFREHLPALSRFLSRRVPLDEVDDIAAQTFEVAWAKRDLVTQGEELPWLYRIATFQIANYRRRAATATNFLRTSLRPDAAPSPEAIAILDVDLAVAYKALTTSERAILSLTAFEGLAVKDAASVLGIKPNAASLKLLRARKKLQELLAEKD